MKYIYLCDTCVTTGGKKTLRKCL
uniref:Uncharacterized protein n=1 Tax=Anguilla anguilla TaxID=7936 RepID=A0A0E9UV28_ANGAN